MGIPRNHHVDCLRSRVARLIHSALTILLWISTLNSVNISVTAWIGRLLISTFLHANPRDTRHSSFHCRGFVAIRYKTLDVCETPRAFQVKRYQQYTRPAYLMQLLFTGTSFCGLSLNRVLRVLNLAICYAESVRGRQFLMRSTANN